MYDETRNEYIPYKVPDETVSEIESANAAVMAAKALASKPAKRSAVVIGAKPQLNEYGLAINSKVYILLDF